MGKFWILIKLIYFLVTFYHRIDCYNLTTKLNEQTTLYDKDYDSHTVQLLQTVTSQYFRSDTQLNVILPSETTHKVTSYLRTTHTVLSVPLLISHIEKGGKTIEHHVNNNKQLGIGNDYIIFIETLTIIDKEITEIQDLLYWNNRGRFLIVPLKKIKNDKTLYNLFRIFWQYKILNVEVLVQTNCQKKHYKNWCSMFLTYNPFKNIDTATKDVSANFSLISGEFRHLNTLFYDKAINLRKYPLYISDISLKGLVTIIRNNDGTFNKTSDILESIIRHMNFTPVLVKEKYAKRLVNTKLPNGTWVGPIEEVASSYADICSFTFNFLIQRWEAVDFCTPIILTAFTFISPTARLVPQWRCFFHPFTKWVWILWALFCVHMVIFEYFIKFMLTKEGETPSVIDSILYVFSIALQISVPKPISTSRKTILIVSVLGFLVLSSLYQSSLVSFMMNPRYYPLINSIDDVADSDLVIEMLPQNIRILESYPQARFKRIVSKSRVAENILGVIEKIVIKGDRLAFNSLFGAQAMDQLYKSRNGKPKMHLVRETIGLLFRSYIVPKNSPYIHHFNRIIDSMVEAGLRHSVKDENADGKNQDNGKDKEEEDNSNQKVLTLYHFQTAFYLFLLGIGFSTIIFIKEFDYSCNVIPYGAES